MKQIVIEGTWEEIVQRADEFKGKRIRLMVMEESALTGPHSVIEPNPLDNIVGMVSSGDGNLSELHNDVLYQIP